MALEISTYKVDAMLEWLILRNCILARDSVATKHIIILTEKLPEIALETAKPVEVTTGVTIRIFDCTCEILTSELTHRLEV
jgi:hypothetical protein